MFNALPERPVVVSDDYDSGFEEIVVLPLHRHAYIKPNTYVVWELAEDRMVAKQKAIQDMSSLYPMFWLRSEVGESVAYEFISNTTAETLGINKINLISSSIAALENLSAPSQKFGVSGLWPTYRRYLDNNGKISRDFLDQQESTILSYLGLSDETLKTEQKAQTLPSFLHGTQLRNSDCSLCFIELDVLNEVHMFAVDEEFFKRMVSNTDKSHILYAGGTWRHFEGQR